MDGYKYTMHNLVKPFLLLNVNQPYFWSCCGLLFEWYDNQLINCFDEAGQH